MISFIVAYAKNQVMGKNNQLPWHIKDDLQLFKKHTLNKPIIMGRKTFESIGRPLPNRRNIILTRQENYQNQDIEVYSSIDDILKLNDTQLEIMIIGGAEIFKLFMPMVERIYLSTIEAEIEGDTFFPIWDQSNWACHSHQNFNKNKENDYPFKFEIWEKKDT
ncbi:dihydrofolate reductase [Thiotrichales bacterium 19S9-12]|nr:dihydrofolate reductase [Thiotrichales bacterium 19S9-11]MCF6811536.1 dihydrofolate reductase [Thiotrichales bacterium 19S9-12]